MEMDALSAMLKAKGKVLMNSVNEKRKNSLSMEDDHNAKSADRCKNMSVFMAHNEMGYSEKGVDISIDARVKKKLGNMVKKQTKVMCKEWGSPEIDIINTCIYNSEED